MWTISHARHASTTVSVLRCACVCSDRGGWGERGRGRGKREGTYIVPLCKHAYISVYWEHICVLCEFAVTFAPGFLLPRGVSAVLRGLSQR